MKNGKKDKEKHNAKKIDCKTFKIINKKQLKETKKTRKDVPLIVYLFMLYMYL